MPFQPGQSGNPGGRPKDRPFRDALLMEAKLAEQGESTPAPEGSLRWNARQLLIRGDVPAIREIADRIDGKVSQPIGGDEDNPLIPPAEPKALAEAILGVLATAKTT